MQTRRIILAFYLLSFMLPAGLIAQVVFQKTYGGTAIDAAYSVQQTTDGGYIIAGYTANFGAGGEDVYVIKTDAFGDTMWTKTYGGTGNDRGYSVQQTPDGGYVVAGYTNSFGAGLFDFYLIRTDGFGDTIWTKTYGGTIDEYCHLVTQTTDSGFIMIGRSYSFGAGARDMYIIRTDANGDTLWTRAFGGLTDDYGHSVEQTADNGYIVGGWTTNYGAGGRDFYLLKLDQIGDVEWTKTYGESDYEYAYSVQQTTDGGYIIAGHTLSFGAGGFDAYLVKTNASGDTLWTKTYGGANTDYCLSIQQTDDDGYIITGYNNSFGAGDYDAYFIKTDAAGDTMWTRAYGGTGAERIYSGRQTSDGGYIAVGWTNSFGAGGQDIYLIKIDADGNGECNFSATNTIVGSTSSLISSGVTVNSGTIVNNPATLVGNTATLDSILCDTCFNPLAAFNYTDSILTVNFTDSSTAATGWFWNFGDGNNSSSQNPSHTYVNGGTYWVCLTVTNDCGTDSVCDSITVIGTGMMSSDTRNFVRIYPNPNSGIFTLEIHLQQSTALSFSIYQVDGKRVYASKVNDAGSVFIQPLDMSTFARGIYYLQVTGNKIMFTKKIILQ